MDSPGTSPEQGKLILQITKIAGIQEAHPQQCFCVVEPPPNYGTYLRSKKAVCNRPMSCLTVYLVVFYLVVFYLVVFYRVGFHKI